MSQLAGGIAKNKTSQSFGLIRFEGRRLAFDDFLDRRQRLGLSRLANEDPIGMTLEARLRGNIVFAQTGLHKIALCAVGAFPNAFPLLLFVLFTLGLMGQIRRVNPGHGGGRRGPADGNGEIPGAGLQNLLKDREGLCFVFGMHADDETEARVKAPNGGILAATGGFAHGLRFGEVCSVSEMFEQILVEDFVFPAPDFEKIREVGVARRIRFRRLLFEQHTH